MPSHEGCHCYKRSIMKLRVNKNSGFNFNGSTINFLIQSGYLDYTHMDIHMYVYITWAWDDNSLVMPSCIGNKFISVCECYACVVHVYVCIGM